MHVLHANSIKGNVIESYQHAQDASNASSGSPLASKRKACLLCQHRKKRCDGLIPNCSQCRKLRLDCTYPHERSLSSAELISRFSNTRGVEYRLPGPVDSEPYMLALINCFKDSVKAMPGPSEEGSVLNYMENDWIPLSLTDPAFFYATLCWASSFYDIVHDQEESRSTVYHQTQTIRFVNQKLAAGDIDDPLVASVVVLAIQAAMRVNLPATLQHWQGLSSIMTARGGLPEETRFSGFIAEVFRINMMLPAMIFDTDTILPVVPGPSPPQPLSFLSWVLNKMNTRPQYQLASDTRLILKTIHESFSDPHQQPTTISLTKVSLSDWMRTKYGIEVKIPETPLQGDPALEACWLATDILWYLLDISETGSESTLQCYLKKLKAAVSKVSRATWITSASEPFLWVALIGAAAAPDQPNRIWFTTLHGCMPSSILTKDVSAYQDFWQCFCWVRDLRRFKMQPVLDISEVDDTYGLADTRDTCMAV
ncbi:hypothetical protein ASPCAL03017 [Aspergillus calidoustus]|uniref:Zn(2)-C6 fungal-type domain-containing protein n=1 Tax=Aspergillus calidoustus TaxID=454130 RepID=A0A0U5GQC1_ASPCI|nr:hypothetical protein ASPCAL03017 [Aspergillus calidoustus]